MSIGWLQPWLLWALPLAATPIVIHLLRTHQARRLPFPSLRFVLTAKSAAVRLRPPSDLLMMTIRVAIVALAVAALAGPVVLTGSRIAAWNARQARAVVVDVSESMRLPDRAGVPESRAKEAASVELGSATYGRQFDVTDLAEGVSRAARWLEQTPPAQREVLVISDMQAGPVAAAWSSLVPLGIGVRVIPVGPGNVHRQFDGVALFGAGRTPGRAQSIDATAAGTSVTLASGGGSDGGGLRIVAPPASAMAVERVLSAVAKAGAPAASPKQPIVIRFVDGVLEPPTVSRIEPGWMLRVVIRLHGDPLFMGRASTENSPGSDPWMIVGRREDGAPLVRAAASATELILDVDAPVDSLFAAQVVRAALAARLSANKYAEQEPDRLSDAVVTQLARPPAPVTHEAWRTADSSDARWCWLAVLVLLAGEQWLRARSTFRREEVIRAAA